MLTFALAATSLSNQIVSLNQTPTFKWRRVRRVYRTRNIERTMCYKPEKKQTNNVNIDNKKKMTPLQQPPERRGEAGSVTRRALVT